MPVAAEYVLGLLAVEERRNFEALLQRGVSARSEVEFWERRLGELASEVRPVEPSPELWKQIEAQLDGCRVNTN